MTEPQMAFLAFEVGKSPSSTIWGTVSKPKYGVISRAMPMIQPGMPSEGSMFVNPNDSTMFEKLQCPQVRISTAVMSVVMMLANRQVACALTRNWMSCMLMMNTSTRNTTAMIMVVPKLRFRPNSLLMNVATAMTTAGGTEIQAAMISHEARNPTCLLNPTVL